MRSYRERNTNASSRPCGAGAWAGLFKRNGKHRLPPFTRKTQQVTNLKDRSFAGAVPACLALLASLASYAGQPRYAHSILTPAIISSAGECRVSQPVAMTLTRTACNMGHAVEHRFDWGNGATSEWSFAASDTNQWLAAGMFEIRAQARCTNGFMPVTSDWSSAFGLTVRGFASAGLDRDGDGIADPCTYDAASGAWNYLCSGSGAEGAIAWGWEEAEAVPGDFDGDGKADPTVYHRDSGCWYIYYSSILAMGALTWGNMYARPVAGDFNGDGLSDPAVYEQNSGEWYVYLNGLATSIAVSWGWNEARPIPADYDGDGSTDFAVFHRASAAWYILQSASGTMRAENWGWKGARPAPADYDGDGRADLAVFDKASANWYILNSASASMTVANWGWAQAAIVPADYDGDGKADLACYDRPSGNWYIRRSDNEAMLILNAGSRGATPLPCYGNGAKDGLRILAFGDSITYGTSSEENNPKTGYPMLLEKKLEALFGGHFVSINKGRPGETTGAGEDRFDGVLDKEAPDIVLLMEGTNDHFHNYPFNGIQARLSSMVQKALGHGCPIILATIPPVISNEYRNRDGQAARIRAFNPRIYDIGAAAGIPIARVYEYLTSVPNWERKLMDQPTANHPNDAGYRYVRDAFFEQVADGMENGSFY